MYSQHNHLYYSNKSLPSQPGVPTAVFPDIVAYNRKDWDKISTLTRHCWYLDDDIIAETETELNEALDILAVSGKTFGLELRTNKCEVWSKGAWTRLIGEWKETVKRDLKYWVLRLAPPDSLLLRNRSVFQRSQNYWRTWST